MNRSAVGNYHCGDNIYHVGSRIHRFHEANHHSVRAIYRVTRDFYQLAPAKLFHFSSREMSLL
jgi:hypothetical protein